MKIIIMRHSIRDDMSNPNKYKGTWNNNCPISDEGRLLLYEKSRRLFIKNKIIPDYIISSPFLRTIQTSEILKKEVRKYKNKDIEIEINSLICEGQLSKKKNFNQELENKLLKDGINIPEKYIDLKKRCKDFIDYCKNLKYNNLLVVTHGIIVNELVKIFIPNYMYKETKDPNEYKPKCAEYIIFEINNNNSNLIHTDFNIDLNNTF